MEKQEGATKRPPLERVQPGSKGSGIGSSISIETGGDSVIIRRWGCYGLRRLSPGDKASPQHM